MASRSLLKEGLIWSAGYGRLIKIWQDQWLTNHYCNKVMSPILNLAPNSTVSELMVHNAPKWNTELIKLIFHDKEAEAILAMPISTLDRNDKQIWRFTFNGIHSV